MSKSAIGTVSGSILTRKQERVLLSLSLGAADAVVILMMMNQEPAHGCSGQQRWMGDGANVQ